MQGMFAPPRAGRQCCHRGAGAAASAGGGAGSSCSGSSLYNCSFHLKGWIRAHCCRFQEYAQGGNLLSYVQAAGRLTEPMAR